MVDFLFFFVLGVYALGFCTVVLVLSFYLVFF